MGSLPSYIDGYKCFLHTRTMIEGNTIAGECAEVQFDCFGDIFLCLFLGLSLGYTARECGYGDDVPAVLILFQRNFKT